MTSASTLIKRVNPLWRIIFATAVLSCGTNVLAAYPDRAITLEVGFAAGGPTDMLARAAALEMGIELGQPIIVDNKPGAGSNIAAVQVAHSKPDGYTLLMVAITSAINQTLYAKPGFDLNADFAPVGMVGVVPSMLVVDPKLPVRNVQELVAYAKANPNTLSFGSSGNGSSIHIAGEMFKSATKIDAVHIPYKGSAPAGVALMGGQITYMFDNVPTVWPFVQAGRMRALAVTTKARISLAPQIPTMAESGFPNFNVSSWYGILAPAGTPEAIIKSLNGALQRVITKPDFQKKMNTLGVISDPGTPQQFGQFMRSEVLRWAPIVKSAGALVD